RADETVAQDRSHEAVINERVAALHAAINKGAENVDFHKAMEALAGLDAEHGDVAALVKAFHERGYSGKPASEPFTQADLGTPLAQRPPARDFGEAQAHPSGDPAKGAIAAMRNGVGDKEYLSGAAAMRELALDGESTAGRKVVGAIAHPVDTVVG